MPVILLWVSVPLQMPTALVLVTPQLVAMIGYLESQGVIDPEQKITASGVVPVKVVPLMALTFAATDPVPGPACTSPVNWLIPVPGGEAQLPSARRKFVVPPPDAGASPCKRLVKVFKNAVATVAV